MSYQYSNRIIMSLIVKGKIVCRTATSLSTTVGMNAFHRSSFGDYVEYYYQINI
jgi:hypothetical protein